MNKKEAEFVGILLGDGYIRSDFKEVKISLDSKKDKTYSRYITLLIKELYGLKARFKKRKNENTIDLRITKKWFGKYLINLGLNPSPKLYKAKIPSKYYNNKFFTNLLKGLFDTDGSLVITNNNGTIYPRLEIKISESPMKYQFIKILRFLGFKFGIYKSNRNQVRIQMNGLTQLRLWVNLISFSNMKHIEKSNIFLN